MRRSFFPGAAFFLGASCLVALASDAFLPPGQDVSLPAIPAQLPHGSKPGTFRFSEPVLVKFKQEQEFPVDLVLRDYAHKEVFRCRIKRPEFSIVSCDLAPGSYDQTYEMTGRARKDYLDWSDPRSIFITSSGRCGIAGQGRLQPLSYEAFRGRYPYDVVFRRRIETLEPVDKAVVSAEGVHFRWKPIPGVEEYTVSAWPIEDLDHPNSSFPAERETKFVKGCEVEVKGGLDGGEWDLHPGEDYVWMVADGNDEDEIAKHIAESESGTFRVEGKLGRVGDMPPKNFMRDEAVEPRLKIRLQQPYITSDGGDGFSTVNVLGIGEASPLLKAGLVTGARIISLNGIATPTLAEFQKELGSLSSGQTVQLGVVEPDPKLPKLVTAYYPIAVP